MRFQHHVCHLSADFAFACFGGIGQPFVNRAINLSVHIEVITDDETGVIGGGTFHNALEQWREFFSPFVIRRLRTLIDNGGTLANFARVVDAVGIAGDDFDVGGHSGGTTAVNHTYLLAAFA